MSKQFWGIIIVVLLALGGLFYVTNHGFKTNGPTAQASNNTQGNPKAPIQLTEYADFECPYCGDATIQLKQLFSEYGSLVAFRFINFPLVSIHPNAFAAARAAEAAALQGKFWQMHDLLYQANIAYYNNPHPTPTWISASNPQPYFDQYAAQIGLNIQKFNKDYLSSRVNNTINADMALGNKIGVDATPTFFVNGKQIQMQSNHSVLYYLNKTINADLQAKGIAPPATAQLPASPSSNSTAKTSQLPTKNKKP